MSCFRAMTSVGLILVASACNRGRGTVSCGIKSLTGPLAVKEAFGEGNGLAEPPETAPPTLPVRLVAGPVWKGSITTDSASGWDVTIAATIAKAAHLGYGVLVVNGQNRALGVLAFEGQPISGAFPLGHLITEDTTVPLLGVRVDAGTVQDPLCPVFPDSLP